MIFRDTIEQMLDGSKTQTRRLSKEGDVAHFQWFYGENRLCKVTRNGRLKWEVGRIYAIQPKRGANNLGYFKLLAIRWEELQDITEADAIAEGIERNVRFYKSPDRALRNVIAQFIHLWDSIHKKPGDCWLGNPSVWVLTFELVK